MARCLIVEDNRMIRIVLRKILEDLGIECVQADDGQSALDEARGTLPDIVITEWQLPSMLGVDLIAQLKALPDGNKAKILFCASESDSSSIKAALAAGADEYIMKPFDAEIVRSKLLLAGVKIECAA